MGGERSMGGKGAHLGDDRRGGVPVEDEQDGGGESTTSRTGDARVGDEQWTSLDEQERSRGGGPAGGTGPAGRRSSGGMDLARRGGPAAGTTKSYAGTSEWRRAPF